MRFVTFVCILLAFITYARRVRFHLTRTYHQLAPFDNKCLFMWNIRANLLHTVDCAGNSEWTRSGYISDIGLLFVCVFDFHVHFTCSIFESIFEIAFLSSYSSIISLKELFRRIQSVFQRRHLHCPVVADSPSSCIWSLVSGPLSLPVPAFRFSSYGPRLPVLVFRSSSSDLRPPLLRLSQTLYIFICVRSLYFIPK